MPASYNEARNIVFLIGRCGSDGSSDKRKEPMSRTIEAIMAHMAPPAKRLTASANSPRFAAQLEADWALHSVPIVFVTSLITPEEARDARRIDGHRISAKPHTAAELLRVVEENLPCCAEA